MNTFLACFCRSFTSPRVYTACIIAMVLVSGCSGDGSDGGCQPTTCSAQGAECGTISDGCGGELACGTCDGGGSCNADNQCVACEATTCSTQGAECGTISDDCGGELACGTCDAGESCNAVNQCQAFPTNPSNDNSPLGTNLNWTVDWSSEIKYANIMKQSRPWKSCRIPSFSWDDGRTLDTDSDGWIRSLASDQAGCALMMWDVPMIPAGRYIVLYDGEGTLNYSRMGTAVKNNALSTNGRDVLDVPEDAGQGISVCVESTHPDNYLRNIRVLLPGGVCSNDRFRHCENGNDCQSPGTCRSYEETYPTQIFNPVFLNDIKKFNVVRFMDLQETNNSPVQHWSDRKQPTAATYVGDEGVPVEVLVDLANTLEANPWFCMPHQADDDYMREFATYVKGALNPNLEVYLEYSNETWNSIFSQSNYVSAQGLAAELATDEFLAGNLYTARRTVEMIDIWTDVFGGAAQLVRVMPGFYISTTVTDTRMEFENAYAKIDAFAIAPYFGRGVSGGNLDAVFTGLETAMADARNAWNNQNDRMVYWSRQAGRPIKLITYEAGQHMISSMVDRANRDARMGGLYKSYLDDWKADIGNLMVLYTSCMKFTDSSAWGLLEYTGQTGSPKYDAAITFIEDNPLPW